MRFYVLLLLLLLILTFEIFFFFFNIPLYPFDLNIIKNIHTNRIMCMHIHLSTLSNLIEKSVYV